MNRIPENKQNIKNNFLFFNKKYLSKKGIQQNIIDIKECLERTPMEIAAGAMLGLFVGGIYQGGVERKRAEFIPLAFSEIEQVEENLKKDNDTIGALTIYSLKVNDLCMKIFEAYNESHGYSPFSDDRADKFGTFLYENETLKIYKYNIKDLLEQVPGHIVGVNKTFTTYKEIDQKLKPIISDLRNTWNDSHHDNYHTEIRTRTVTDAKGKSHTETYTVQVYDNTTHTYIYNKNYGEEVDFKLNRLSKDCPIIAIDERIIKTDQTNAFGEFAADKSRQRLSERLSPEELLEVANSWYHGSTLLNNIQRIEALYPELLVKSEERSTLKKSAKSDKYKTNSHYDDGSVAFQTIEKSLQISNEVDNSIKEILNVVEETSQKIPLLEKRINEYIEDFKQYKTTDEKAEEIMNLTKQIYILNFKTGIDVERFRWAMIFLITLLGGAIGAGLGGIVDYADNKYKLYDKIFGYFFKDK